MTLEYCFEMSFSRRPFKHYVPASMFYVRSNISPPLFLSLP